MTPTSFLEPDPSARPPTRCRRLVLVLPLVLLGAAALLRALDSVPALVRGEPRGVRRYDRLEVFERDVRTQLLLPYYFPASLAWPPEAIYWAGGDGRPTSVVFTDRRTGRPRLLIAQCLDGDCTIPARLLPRGREIDHRQVEIGREPARWTRQVGTDGTEWTDLQWRSNGRRVVLRLVGDDRDALRFARSLRRGLP